MSTICLDVKELSVPFLSNLPFQLKATKQSSSSSPRRPKKNTKRGETRAPKMKRGRLKVETGEKKKYRRRLHVFRRLAKQPMNSAKKKGKNGLPF